MAEENTTDSTATTETPATETATPEAGSTDTSTTEQAKPETILTEAPAEEQTQTEETETPPQTEEDAERAKLFGAPEGDYELALPEGVTVDTEALAAVAPVAKELGLSNEGLSRIAGVYAEKVLPQVTQQVVSGIERDVAATHAQWATETQEAIQSDPAFEEHRDIKQVQSIAAKAMDRLFDPSFRDFLRETGTGNHPAMVKAMYLVGTKIAEDTTFERGGTPPREKTRAEKFYGS